MPSNPQEVSHLQVPVSVDNDTINKKDIDFYARKGYFDHLVNSEAAFGGRGGGTMTAEDMHMYSKYNYNYSTGQNLKDFMGTTSMAGQDMSMSQYRSTAFDGMALPSYYLQAYYFDVSFITVYLVESPDFERFRRVLNCTCNMFLFFLHMPLVGLLWLIYEDFCTNVETCKPFFFTTVKLIDLCATGSLRIAVKER